MLDNPEIDIQVCNNLKQYRTEVLNISQVQLAELCDVSQKTISRAEAGVYNVSPKVIKALVGKTRLNADWMLFNTGSPRKSRATHPKDEIGVLQVEVAELKKRMFAIEKTINNS